MGSRKMRCKHTPDLLEGVGFETKRAFPVRQATNRIRAEKFSAKMKHATARALKECDLPRDAIAEKMADMLDCPSFSKNMLDSYASERRGTHQLTLVRFKALVKVTGAKWLYDELVEDDGCVVLEGEEARLAESGLIEQRIKQLKSRKKELGSMDNVKVRRRSA
ncbi:MAG: hypothetical protein GY804_00720 [Alphaproteobacteria bacterium]|nr:hypothetical protein [Alphaproteobacteria bacterium]